VIELEHITKAFAGAGVVVDDLSLHVAEGQTTVLLGPSGCGKTTLLKMIARLEVPDAGSITLDGEPIDALPLEKHRRRLGFVFQQPGLFPHKTVAENVGLIPKLEGRDTAWIDARVDELLQLMELPPSVYRTRYPDALSGGQQQRVGVARALANKPRYMLMDEPFSALDSITRRQLQAEVRHIANTLGVTIVFVTHDVFEAMAIGDRIAVMHKGRIEQLGSAEDIVNQPATDYVRELIAKPVREAHASAAAVMEGAE